MNEQKNERGKVEGNYAVSTERNGFVKFHGYLVAGCILAVVGHLLFLINPFSYEWAMAVTIIRGIGQAPLTALVFGMMGYVIEYGQWKFHIRQESLVFGGGSLGFKIGTGLTSAMISALLTGAGYLSSTTGGAVQPESAKHMIIAIYELDPLSSGV